MDKVRHYLLLKIIFVCSNYLLVHCDCDIPSTSSNVTVDYPAVSGQREKISEQTMLEMTCKDGFTALSGDSVIMCLDSKWQVIDGDTMRPQKQFRCKEKQCPVKNPVNGVAVLEGKKVLYSCNKGYRLVGMNTSMCRLNRKKDYYVASIPICKERPECKRPSIPALSYNGPIYDGEIAIFSCRDGYELIGATTVTCGATGNWEKQLPYCKLIPACDDPGMSQYSNRTDNCCNVVNHTRNCCDVGMSLTYTCDEDYELLDGDIGGTITCVENDKWSAPKPICIPIGSAVCPDVPALKEYNVRILGVEERFHPDVYLPYDELCLECIENHATNSSLGLDCWENGTWSDPFPVCYPMSPCGLPRVPKNGRVLELENNDQKDFHIGFEINFECDDGYIIQSGKYGTKCLGDKWESESEDCTRISCSDPGIPDNGIRDSSSFYLGDTVSFSCKGNYKLYGSSKRVCLKNRRWSGLITVCDSGASYCIDPGTPVNSYRIGSNFNEGDIVVYSCKSNYTMFGQNGTRQCLPNRSWSGEQIECYGENEFSDVDEVSDSLAETMTSIARSAFGSPMQVDLTRLGVSPVNNDDFSCVNVFFLLDASASIPDLNFNQAKEFIKIIIRKVGISDDTLGVRMGVIAFSAKPKQIFGPEEKNFQVAIEQLNNIKRVRKTENLILDDQTLIAEGTDMKKALEKLEEIIVAQRINEPERAHAKSIAFLLSDGSVTEGGTPVQKVKHIEKNHNIVFHTIAIGTKLNLPILSNISSKVLMFANHGDLLKLVEKTIGTRIDFSPCGLDRPDYGWGNDTAEPQNRSKRSMHDLTRIVGKPVARPWPWITALRVVPIPEHRHIRRKYNLTGVVCGGSIIHSEWILTAAHCFTDSRYSDLRKLLSTAENWRVTAGRTNISLASGLEFHIKAIYPHPLYADNTQDYDIALLKTFNPIPFDHFIRPICLPPSYPDLPNDTYIYKPKEIATVIGWGHTDAHTVNVSKNYKYYSDVYLNEAEVPIQYDRICHQPFNYTTCRNIRCYTKRVTPPDRLMCTGDGTTTSDACKGDSGGPLMQQLATYGGKHPVERWFHIGIVSWGIGCGQKEFHSYYTNTAKIRSFIENITQVEFENIHLKPM